MALRPPAAVKMASPEGVEGASEERRGGGAVIFLGRPQVVAGIIRSAGRPRRHATGAALRRAGVGVAVGVTVVGHRVCCSGFMLGEDELVIGRGIIRWRGQSRCSVARSRGWSDV